MWLCDVQYNNRNRTEGETGADCNQVIMFLTDGGTEKPEELFKEHNANKKVSRTIRNAHFLYRDLLQLSSSGVVIRHKVSGLYISRTVLPTTTPDLTLLPTSG